MWLKLTLTVSLNINITNSQQCTVQGSNKLSKTVAKGKKCTSSRKTVGVDKTFSCNTLRVARSLRKRQCYSAAALYLYVIYNLLWLILRTVIFSSKCFPMKTLFILRKPFKWTYLPCECYLMVMFRHSQHLVNVKERSQSWFNIEKSSSTHIYFINI